MHLIPCLTAACCLLQGELQEALNVALRVRDSLSGIDSNPRCPHDLWAAAMAALKGRNRSLDAENVDRLFGRDNRQVWSSHDAALHENLQVLSSEPQYCCSAFSV